MVGPPWLVTFGLCCVPITNVYVIDDFNRPTISTLPVELVLRHDAVVAGRGGWTDRRGRMLAGSGIR